MVAKLPPTFPSEWKMKINYHFYNSRPLYHNLKLLNYSPQTDILLLQ